MHAPRVGGLTVALWLAVAHTAGAQGVAESFQELRFLTGPGETISVIGEDGEELTGRIAELSAVRLRLLGADGPRDLIESEVRTIWQWRGDSLKNGTVWGLAVGLVVGGIGAVAMCYDGPCDATVVGAVLVGGGMGAGIGVGVDALIKRRQVIYARPGASTTTLAVLPIIAPAHQGVAVSFLF